MKSRETINSFLLSLKSFGQSVYHFWKTPLLCPTQKIFHNIINWFSYLKKWMMQRYLGETIMCNVHNSKGSPGGFSLFVFQKRNKLLLIAALHTMFCSTFSKSGFTLWKKRAKPRRAFGIVHFALLSPPSNIAHYCHPQVTLYIIVTSK